MATHYPSPVAITDIEARDKVLAAIDAARKVRAGAHGSFLVIDWTKAKWLARGERAACIVGGLANSVIYSPAWARADIGWDRLLFYGPTGVLCHEEPARQLEMRKIESLNALLDADGAPPTWIRRELGNHPNRKKR